MTNQPNEPETNCTSQSSQPDDSLTRVTLHVDLPPGARVQITIEDQSVDGEAPRISRQTYLPIQPGQAPRPGVLSNSGIRQWPLWEEIGIIWQTWKQRLFSDVGLFLFSLAVYLATRFIGLADWPIFFFTDEAVQTVLAADFVRDGFRNYVGELLPTFFINNTLYCLSTSVYAQVIPYLIFGKSVLATRGSAMLVTLLAAVWIGWICRDIFKLRYWWSATLFFSITPAWFLHSRTAFEYGMLVTFYTGFLYFYWRYRCDQPRYLYLALVMGGLAFYSYMPGQVIMVSTGVLLLLFDIRYHWRNRQTGLKALGVLALVVLPLARFLISHPNEFQNRLLRYNSFLVQDTPLREKLLRMGSEYLAGLDPTYWFLPNNHDLFRHLMKGYGHILWWTFPFAVFGLYLVFRKHWRNAASPMIAALLAAPTGGVTVALGITRSLVMVIPVALLSAIGLEAALDWLIIKRGIKRSLVTSLAFLILVGVNFYMSYDVLANGARWYEDYALNGMQYGARQVFTEVKVFLEEDPKLKIDVSPTWTNGADVVARFFLGDPLPIEMASIEGYLNSRRPLTDKNLFVMTPEEYEKAANSPKLTDVRVEQILPYPNGKPGFYFVRFRYVDNFDQILVDEQANRRTLQEADLLVAGEQAHVKYSMLDMGSVDKLFDNNLYSVTRTLEANPMVVQIQWQKPRNVQFVDVQVGGGPTGVEVQMQLADEERKISDNVELPGMPNPRLAEFNFGEPFQVISMEVRIRNLDVGEPSHVHVWEILIK